MAQGAAYPPADGRANDLVYVHDAFGTLFALERVRATAWDDALLEPPCAKRADARLVLLAHGNAPAGLPGWLAVGREDAPEVTGEALPLLARRLWVRSPHHREPGPTPEAFLREGFHALCPPHPLCELGPRARAGIAAFARGRGGDLAHLAEEGRDGFDRWLRVSWEKPEVLAGTVLMERMLDERAFRAVAVIRQVQRAEVEVGSECDALARERASAARADRSGALLRAAG